jgi:O-acetyl-ADP-ribose deacetylase (regulator of RNase III)
VKVSAYVGSIVDVAVGAHAIVNASNPEVGLGSGVSGAIRAACGGAAYQVEVRTRLEEEFGGPLEAQDCLVTGAGSAAAFRWVLHVAGVNYRSRDPETGGVSGPSRVRACTRAALSEAAELARANHLAGSFVVATPLLAAGHGGLGATKSLGAMIDAVDEWLRADAANREVLAELKFCVLLAEEARLVPLAAAKLH